ncbi:MAG: DUF3800 domain-containing protein [Candidatus Micrarchaeota archaeon]
MIDWFVFVDESGDLGKFGSPYFIVAAIEVRDDKPLFRIIKRAREKLKKKLKELPELKAAKTNEELRKFVLRKISELDCRIYLCAVEKKRIRPNLMAAQNQLYNWLCRVLCQKITHGKIRLVLDKKYNSVVLRSELAAYLQRELSWRGINVSVEQLESRACPPLQVVDFIAWAAHRKFSFGDDSYYSIIAGKIANGSEVELWK